MKSEYLTSVRKEFIYYKSLGEKTFAQLSDENLFWRNHEISNSIAMIVNHLWGNMLSRWTDFLTSDGEKIWRDREDEFRFVIRSRASMLDKWEAGWTCLFEALDSLDKVSLDHKVYIRNQEHSIIAAVNRQLAHYSYHIGQIVYLGKMLQSNNWRSLSISKGESTQFNKRKFSKGKHSGHFSDDLL